MTATVSRVRMYKPTGDIGRRLQEAYQLQADIAALEDKLKVHRDFILMHMEEKSLDKIQLNDIIVYRRIRHKWSYSIATRNEMLKLQTTQEYEQAEGIATDTPRVYIALTHKGAQK
jgi:hypothetical protein